jgi:hypothetical protein
MAPSGGLTVNTKNRHYTQMQTDPSTIHLFWNPKPQYFDGVSASLWYERPITRSNRESRGAHLSWPRNDYMSEFNADLSFEETMASIEEETIEEEKTNVYSSFAPARPLWTVRTPFCNVCSRGNEPGMHGPTHSPSPC